jgi:hypothetical protein
MQVQKRNRIRIWFLTSSLSKIRQMVFNLWHSARRKLNSAVGSRNAFGAPCREWKCFWCTL